MSAWSARHLHASFEDKFLFIYLFYCGLIRVMNSMACEHYFNNCSLQQQQQQTRAITRPTPLRPTTTCRACTPASWSARVALFIVVCWHPRWALYCSHSIDFHGFLPSTFSTVTFYCAFAAKTEREREKGKEGE